MRVVAVRPHLVWGPGDTQLVARIVERARRGRLPLLDGGTALIDTTYVDNAAIGDRAPRSTARRRRTAGRTSSPTASRGRSPSCSPGSASPPACDRRGGACRRGSPARPAPSIERVWAIRPGADEPPMTRFLAEQLSTAHWFDQRDTRRALAWAPAVSIDEGLRRLAAHYAR